MFFYLIQSTYRSVKARSSFKESSMYQMETPSQFVYKMNVDVATSFKDLLEF